MGWGDSTHWSLLVTSRRGGPAWEFFYRNYRAAVGALFRARGVVAGDVDDLVQQFFLVAFQRKFLEKADPTRGRFRAYLRTAAGRFAVDHFRREGRRRRVGANYRLAQLRRTDRLRAKYSPEEAFDRAWARSLLTRSRVATMQFLCREGKEAYFANSQLRDQGLSWQEIADQTETTPEAARSRARYTREVFLRFLETEVGTTVGEGFLDLELSELWAFLWPHADRVTPPEGCPQLSP